MNTSIMYIWEMNNISHGNISLSSRYFEPFSTLRRIISSQNVFKLIYNSDKETYHLPYLYGNYTNQLEPVFITAKLVDAIKKYIADNLFSIEEIKLLLSELIPVAESFGDDTVKSLSKRIDVTDDEKIRHEQYISECKKTIEALKKIKEILNVEIQSYYMSVTKSSEQFIADLATCRDLFNKDYPNQKTAFIMMQFSNSKLHTEIVSRIKEILKKHGIIGLRADDKEYSDDLFRNIRTYMHFTDFGIAVFERILEDDFNPNVSLEVGYMMGLGKNICFLKDQNLKNLPSDLVGKLYRSFDIQDIENTLSDKLEKWMSDKGII